MLKRNTKVELERNGSVTLRPSDHLATGGEGSVYRTGSFVVKLYTDPKAVSARSIVDRVRRLSVLGHAGISRPRGMVLSSKGDPIGVYMSFVEGESLPRIATTEFWNRTGFSMVGATRAVSDMYDIVSHTHAHQVLMVDANELNWLFGMHDVTRPRTNVIDVDAWAVGPHKAAAIMPSIQDHHTKGFSPLSDWFSWGVVTFQLFTGIHPYKGGLDGYKPVDMVRRMKDNASVFANGVRLNRAVRDFSNIPAPLLSWYEAVFQHGERLPPPNPSQTGVGVPAAARVVRVSVSATGALVHNKLFVSPNDDAIRVFPCGIVLCSSGQLFDLQSRKVVGSVPTKACEVVRIDGHWLVITKETGGYKSVLINTTSHKSVPVGLPEGVTRIVVSQGRVFSVSDTALHELVCALSLRTPQLIWGKRWGILGRSTTWFHGVGVENAMGAAYLILPFGEGGVAHVRVRELDGLSVVSARSSDRTCVITGQTKQGDTVRLLFSFNAMHATYTVMKHDVDTADLNAVALPKRVVAYVEEDGMLCVAVPSTGVCSSVKDRGVTTDLPLFAWGDRVLYLKDGAVWSLSMR